MRDISLVRVARTPSSERYLLRNKDGDVGGLDLHYLANASVQATLLLHRRLNPTEAEIGELLRHLDEALLPEVRVEDHNLTFTVVVGDIVGDFRAEHVGE